MSTGVCLQTQTLVCLCMCRCVRAVTASLVFGSSSCVGHPNWDKVRENVCGWYLLGEQDMQGIAHIAAHTTNQQTNTHAQKPIYNFNLPNIALSSNINYFPYIICQKNLPLNIKHTCEHLQRLAQETDHIHHDVLMLSARCAHRGCWTQDKPGQRGHIAS